MWPAKTLHLRLDKVRQLKSERTDRDVGELCTVNTCVNMLKSGSLAFSVLTSVQRSRAYLFIEFIVCDLNNPGLDPHVLFLRSPAQTVRGTHTPSPVSNPRIDWAALKIKFLLLIIFLVIRKYTWSSVRGMLRHWQIAHIAPLLFPPVSPSVLVFLV